MQIKRSPVEVWNLWESCRLDTGPSPELKDLISKLLMHWYRYDQVGLPFGIPPWVIAAIHYRESSCNFTTWLANGDPLFRHGVPSPTVHVPKGLGPCVNWTEAAIESLKHQGWHSGMEWDLVSALVHLEEYNGLGYLKHRVLSPYIWSGTNHYTVGKYASDGVYDPSLKDKQLGCAAIAQGLKIHGLDLNEKKFV